MIRMMKTAEEIRALIRAAKDDAPGTALTPFVLDEPDAAGCNWVVTTNFIACSPECMTMVEGVIAYVRHSCNLE